MHYFYSGAVAEASEAETGVRANVMAAAGAAAEVRYGTGRSLNEGYRRKGRDLGEGKGDGEIQGRDRDGYGERVTVKEVEIQGREGQREEGELTCWMSYKMQMMETPVSRVKV